jgi:hypothetical protein
MNLYNFKTTKDLLRHYISQLPKKGHGEISRIAKHLNVSTTLVSHVLAGTKFFTTEQAESLSSYLGLLRQDADYFIFLVQLERAGSATLKKYWQSKLEEIREQSLKISNRIQTDKLISENEKAIFYSSPIYSILRIYTSIGDNGKSLSELAERLGISMLKCSEAMQFLVECGLCIEKAGRYIIGAQKIHLERNSAHLLRFHTDWRMRACRRGEELSDEELMYTGLVSLSKKDFALLREEMVLFIKNFLDKVHVSPAEEIACLNLDFIWIKN